MLGDLWSLRLEVFGLFEDFKSEGNIDNFILWALNLHYTDGPVIKILRQPNDEVLEAFSGEINTIGEFVDAFEAIYNQRVAEGLEKSVRFELPALPDFRTCDSDQVREVYGLYLPAYKRNRAEHEYNSNKPLLDGMRDWLHNAESSQSQ